MFDVALLTKQRLTFEVTGVDLGGVVVQPARRRVELHAVREYGTRIWPQYQLELPETKKRNILDFF